MAWHWKPTIENLGLIGSYEKGVLNENIILIGS